MQTPMEFVQEWIKRVLSHDAGYMISLYKDDAVLFGTIDRKLRNGKSNIKEYFDNFFKLQPSGKLKKILCEEYFDGYLAIANGYYDFELGKGQKGVTISARFTFVLEKVDSNWKILSHHSSKVP